MPDFYHIGCTVRPTSRCGEQRLRSVPMKKRAGGAEGRLVGGSKLGIDLPSSGSNEQ